MAKMKKAQFGREVTKTEGRKRNSDGSYNKVKTKMVFNKEGDVIKTKQKSTSYEPTGQMIGNLSVYEPGKTTVTKQKYAPGSQSPTSKKTRTGITPVKKQGGSVKKKK
jgi:hypothetical protein